MKKKCPIVKEECWEHGCEFYTHLLGSNSQTGTVEDKWGCAISWLPILMIENAAVNRQTTASVDKTATEVAKHHATFLSVLNHDAQQRLLDADPRLKITNGKTGE